MRASSPPRVPCWLLEFILPVSYRQEMLGDLIEEYNLRANSTSTLELSLWFWNQTCRCIPSLIWSLLRNGDWLMRLLVAFGVYVAMAILRFAAGAAISKLVAPGETTRVVLAPIVFLVTTAIGGCVVARIRREATVSLALMVMVSVVVLIAIKICTTPVPWWYQFGFLTLGPASVLITPAVVWSRRLAPKRFV
jgi:hypothetical protein